MRGCSTNADKRCEIGSLLEDRKLDVLALSETKMKGKGESVFTAVEGRISGVMNGRAIEGVGLLLSERLMACVVEWKEVSSRLMWVKVKFGCEVWMFISAYGPGSERSEDERTSFWNELSECVRIVKVRENVVVLGDLNIRLNIRLNGEVLEEVQMFKYLGSNVTAKGDVVDEVVYREVRLLK